MGRVVGYLDSSHGIPSTYERLPVFLDASHILGASWTRLPAFLDSRHTLEKAPEYNGFIQVAFRHSLNAKVRRVTSLRVSHALPAMVKRQGSVTVRHKLSSWEHARGVVNLRHGGPHAWGKISYQLYDTHKLNARVRCVGALSSGHRVSAYQRLGRLFHSRHSLLPSTLTRWGFHAGHAVSVRTKAGKRLTLRHSLPIWHRMSGPVSLSHALNAYVGRKGWLDAAHALPVCVRAAGAVSARHALLVSARELGWLNAQHALLIDPFNEELGSDVHTWAVNARTGAPSRYKQFPFHGYASSFGGIAAASDGIYALDGGDDDGRNINCEITTPWYDAHQPDVGGTLLKRIIAIVFGGNIDAIEVVPELDDSNDTPFIYRRGQGVQNHSRVRVKFRQGLKSRLFRFVIRNYEGGDMTIESADVEVEHLPSRER